MGLSVEMCSFAATSILLTPKRIGDYSMKPITVRMQQIKGVAMECDREQFAIALKTWRLRNGLTQKDAGKILGVSRWTMMKAEAARAITWETTYRLFAGLSKELEKEADNK